MKQLKFLETKRTPRYSLRKFSVGMVSVLLGVTIFGINFTNHSVKAATTESVETNTQKAASATEKVQQNGASNDVTEKVQQSSASNTATANNSIESATTLQSAPKTQVSADTDIKSSAATVDQNNTILRKQLVQKKTFDKVVQVRMQQLIILQNLRQPHNLHQIRKVALTLILNH